MLTLEDNLEIRKFEVLISDINLDQAKTLLLDMNRLMIMRQRMWRVFTESKPFL